MPPTPDNWNLGDPYEYFMGRWSSKMAMEFLKWLHCDDNLNWIDIGCGTGALGTAISNTCKPQQVTFLDMSEAFLMKARERVSGNTDFIASSAEAIPRDSETFDVAVSGLALNFFPDTGAALSEMKRIVKPGGVVAAYVWDYAGRMEFLRIFWDTVCELHPGVKAHDEGERFPLCNAANLAKLFIDAQMDEISTGLIDIETTFKNFDDYWNPFLGNQGPAPGYVSTLSETDKMNLREVLRKKLQADANGEIKLIARAIAVKGIALRDP